MRYDNSPTIERGEDGRPKVGVTKGEAAPQKAEEGTVTKVGGEHEIHMRHHRERHEMHGRHEAEHLHAHLTGKATADHKKTIHARHEKERADMHRRHEAELKGAK